jgi:hypothetical protein
VAAAVAGDLAGMPVFTGSVVWARPGRASNSARMAMTGPGPFLKLATKAVGMPATPAFTSKPAVFSWPCSTAVLLVSW